MTLARSRHNMIEQQLRTWDVLDERVLELYERGKARREDYVARGARDLCYADAALPIDEGQCMLEPKLEGRMLQVLALRSDERVLHVGAGSGFFAALLGQLSAVVHSVEIRPSLAAAAARRLVASGLDNVHIVTGDGNDGWQDAAPYDAIVLTGSTPAAPQKCLRQLADGGRLLAVVGDAPAMTLRLYRRHGDAFIPSDILETCIPPLDHSGPAERFDF